MKRPRRRGREASRQGPGGRRAPSGCGRAWRPDARVAPAAPGHRVEEEGRGPGRDLRSREREQIDADREGSRQQVRNAVPHGLRRATQDHEDIEVASGSPVPSAKEPNTMISSTSGWVGEKPRRVGVHGPAHHPFIDRLDDDTTQGEPPRWRWPAQPRAACRSRPAPLVRTRSGTASGCSACPAPSRRRPGPGRAPARGEGSPAARSGCDPTRPGVARWKTALMAFSAA